MRRRLAAVRIAAAAVLAIALAGCTSSGHHGPSTTSSPNTSVLSSGQVLTTSTGSAKPVSAYCAKLEAAGKRIQTEEVQLYTTSGQSSVVAALEAQLDALKSGAPAQIKTALGDLASAFSAAQQLLAHPTAENKAALVSVASKLATDGQKITAYVASKC